jgi:hypothetical protein
VELENLVDLNVKALRALAGELGVGGRSSMRKDELIAAIEAVRAVALVDDGASGEEIASVEEVDLAASVVTDEGDAAAVQEPTDVYLAEGPPLPAVEGRRLRVMVRDPGTQFAYWHGAAAPDDAEWEVVARGVERELLDRFRTPGWQRSGYLRAPAAELAEVAVGQVRAGAEAAEPVMAVGQAAGDVGAPVPVAPLFVGAEGGGVADEASLPSSSTSPAGRPSSSSRPA